LVAGRGRVGCATPQRSLQPVRNLRPEPLRRANYVSFPPRTPGGGAHGTVLERLAAVSSRPFPIIHCLNKTQTSQGPRLAATRRGRPRQKRLRGTEHLTVKRRVLPLPPNARRGARTPEVRTGRTAEDTGRGSHSDISPCNASITCRPAGDRTFVRERGDRLPASLEWPRRSNTSALAAASEASSRPEGSLLNFRHSHGSSAPRTVENGPMTK